MTPPGGERIPQRRKLPHYHGDEARALFLAGAIVLIVGESLGASLPVSTVGAVIIAIALVIVAGIENPDQFGIHWFSGFLSAGGVLLFGTSVVEHYQAGHSVFEKSFFFSELLTIMSLVALYYTTRTIRGIIQRNSLE